MKSVPSFKFWFGAYYGFFFSFFGKIAVETIVGSTRSAYQAK